jgi:hypothetical protein
LQENNIPVYEIDADRDAREIHDEILTYIDDGSEEE